MTCINYHGNSEKKGLGEKDLKHFVTSTIYSIFSLRYNYAFLLCHLSRPQITLPCLFRAMSQETKPWSFLLVLFKFLKFTFTVFHRVFQYSATKCPRQRTKDTPSPDNPNSFYRNDNVTEFKWSPLFFCLVHGQFLKFPSRVFQGKWPYSLLLPSNQGCVLRLYLNTDYFSDPIYPNLNIFFLHIPSKQP